MRKIIKLVAVSIFLLAVLLPIFFLSFYIHPATDDFGFYLGLKNTNIVNTVLGIINGMDSRLSGDFYTLLFCPVGSLLRYRITTAVFIILFFASVYLLFIACNKFWLRTSTINIYLFFAIFCFLFVGYMPGLSEAFYWYPGIVIWMFAVCLFNFFIVLILNYPHIKSAFLRRIDLFLICFLGFSFTTHNEILLLFMGYTYKNISNMVQYSKEIG